MQKETAVSARLATSEKKEALFSGRQATQSENQETEEAFMPPKQTRTRVLDYSAEDDVVFAKNVKDEYKEDAEPSAGNSSLREQMAHLENDILRMINQDKKEKQLKQKGGT